MKRFAMIMLHKDGSRKTCYDYNSGDYLQHTEAPQNKGSGYIWLVVQPFVIFGLEMLGEWMSSYPAQIKAGIGIATFLFGAVISTISWEGFLCHYGNRMERESVKIAEPPDAVRRQWASDFPRRIRNAKRLMAIFAVVTIILISVFMVTGVPLALTFALCVYCIAYFIWASARPNLLIRFFKNKSIVK